MRGNPESSSELPVEQIMTLEAFMDEGLTRFGQSVQRAGGAYNFYRAHWYMMDARLRDTIRRTVRAAYPSSLTKLHPFAAATEMGLVLGSGLSAEVLEPWQLHRFGRRMCSALEALAKQPTDADKDLAYAMQWGGGRRFSEAIQETALPVIFDIGIGSTDPIDQRRQRVFLDAMGYVGASCQTMLTEFVMREGHELDTRARAELKVDLMFLETLERPVSTSDFVAD